MSHASPSPRSVKHGERGVAFSALRSRAAFAAVQSEAGGRAGWSSAARVATLAPRAPRCGARGRRGELARKRGGVQPRHAGVFAVAVHVSARGGAMCAPRPTPRPALPAPAARAPRACRASFRSMPPHTERSGGLCRPPRADYHEVDANLFVGAPPDPRLAPAPAAARRLTPPCAPRLQGPSPRRLPTSTGCGTRKA